MVYCFSDLAVDALRENLSIPVVGPGAVALSAADMLSNRFTVVTTVERNVSRTLRRLKQNPVCREKMAGVRALNIPVTELRDNPKATMRYLNKLCRMAVEEDRADTLVLDCLGLAEYGDALEQEFGIKVIDPAFLAVAWAEMAARAESAAVQTFLWECGYTGGSMSQISDCLDLLRQLVAIPSESQNEEAHARFLADYLKDELEMETQLQHVEGKSYNVTGCWHPIKGKARRKLMLGGHLDTVSPTDLWETDPYRLVQQGDQLHGLGAGDMKGGLAAQLMVLKSLKEQGGLWDAEVEFVGLADEERHSVGANAYVRRVQEEKQPQPETFFIMAEPHFDNIVVGATGKVLLKLEVTGAPGHAAMPEKGINAVDCMAALLQAVNQTWGSCYREGRVGSHCCLMIHSDYPGYSLNIPQRCTCLINKQLMAEERGEDFLEDLKRIYEKAVGQGTLRVTRQIPSYPSYQLPKNQPDLAALRTLLKQRFQRVPELKINQSVSDGNILYQSLGIPTILYGPRGVDFHTEREYLSCSSLEQYMEELEAYIKTRYAGA